MEDFNQSQSQTLVSTPAPFGDEQLLPNGGRGIARESPSTGGCDSHTNGVGSGLELLVFAVASICYAARTSKTRSEGVALALFYSLYWVVEAQMHFPTFYILYRRKNNQYLSVKIDISFRYQLVITLIMGQTNYTKINSTSTYSEYNNSYDF